MYIYDPARGTRLFQHRWTFEQKPTSTQRGFVDYCLRRRGGERREQTWYSESWRKLESHEHILVQTNGWGGLGMNAPPLNGSLFSYTPEQTWIIWPHLPMLFLPSSPCVYIIAMYEYIFCMSTHCIACTHFTNILITLPNPYYNLKIKWKTYFFTEK